MERKKKCYYARLVFVACESKKRQRKEKENYYTRLIFVTCQRASQQLFNRLAKHCVTPKILNSFHSYLRNRKRKKRYYWKRDSTEFDSKKGSDEIVISIRFMNNC